MRVPAQPAPPRPRRVLDLHPRARSGSAQRRHPTFTLTRLPIHRTRARRTPQPRLPCPVSRKKSGVLPSPPRRHLACTLTRQPARRSRARQPPPPRVTRLSGRTNSSEPLPHLAACPLPLGASSARKNQATRARVPPAHPVFPRTPIFREPPAPSRATRGLGPPAGLLTAVLLPAVAKESRAPAAAPESGLRPVTGENRAPAVALRSAIVQTKVVVLREATPSVPPTVVAQRTSAQATVVIVQAKVVVLRKATPSVPPTVVVRRTSAHTTVANVLAPGVRRPLTAYTVGREAPRPPSLAGTTVTLRFPTADASSTGSEKPVPPALPRRVMRDRALPPVGTVTMMRTGTRVPRARYPGNLSLPRMPAPMRPLMSTAHHRRRLLRHLRPALRTVLPPTPPFGLSMSSSTFCQAPSRRVRQMHAWSSTRSSFAPRPSPSEPRPSRTPWLRPFGPNAPSSLPARFAPRIGSTSVSRRCVASKNKPESRLPNPAMPCPPAVPQTARPVSS